MTQAVYKQAKMLEEQIHHIGILIDLLNRSTFNLDPPIRKTTYDLWRASDAPVNLNEGEVECIKKALSEERERLIQKFNDL